MAKRLTAEEIEARAKAVADKVRRDGELRSIADRLREIAALVSRTSAEDMATMLDEVAERRAKVAK
jgi:hypothetical protein